MDLENNKTEFGVLLACMETCTIKNATTISSYNKDKGVDVFRNVNI